MIGCIDDHRFQYGVEPMCCVIQIAPSPHYEARARDREPARRPAERLMRIDAG
jgi:putative transposase